MRRRTIGIIVILLIILSAMVLFLTTANKYRQGGAQTEILFRGEGLLPVDFEKWIAVPVENILANISGVKQYLSICRQDNYSVIVEFYKGADLTKVYSEIEERIRKFHGKLPPFIGGTIIIPPEKNYSPKIYVKLKPFGQEDIVSVGQTIEKPRLEITFFRPVFIHSEEPKETVSNEVMIELYGYNYDTLKDLAKKILVGMENMAELKDIKIRMHDEKFYIYIDVNEELCARFGLMPYDVMLAVKENINNVNELQNLVIYNKSGENIFLKRVAQVTFEVMPSEIWRKNGHRMVQVSVNMPKDKNKEELFKELKQIISSNVTFPDGYFFDIHQ